MDLFDRPAARPETLDRAEKIARLRLIRSENIGPITFRQLISRYQTAAKALEALPGLARRGGKAALNICSEKAALGELAAAEKLGQTALYLGEAAYPALLAEIEDAPPVIYARGHAHLAQKPAVALVGARNASAAGNIMAEKLARDLGAQGYAVISGLARGIDAAAHRGSLSSGTVAVVAGGIDVRYPKENEALYEAVAAQGLILSEMPPGTVPQASHFPRRNRIISGLSLGVVVVEANLKSGSLITARLALEQGREVFAVPGSPMDPRAHGPNNLIRQGATLTSSAADVIEVLSQGRPTASEPAAWGYDGAPQSFDDHDVEAARRQVSALLSPVPVAADDLIRQTGLPAALVLAALLELEIGGVIQRHPGHRVSFA